MALSDWISERIYNSFRVNGDIDNSQGTDIVNVAVSFEGDTFEIFEGTGTGSNETKTFSWKTKSIMIANDGATDLTFKFTSADSFSTLLAGESLDIDFGTTTVIINTSVDYRIWGYR